MKLFSSFITTDTVSIASIRELYTCGTHHYLQFCNLINHSQLPTSAQMLTHTSNCNTYVQYLQVLYRPTSQLSTIFTYQLMSQHTSTFNSVGQFKGNLFYISNYGMTSFHTNGMQATWYAFHIIWPVTEQNKLILGI